MAGLERVTSHGRRTTAGENHGLVPIAAHWDAAAASVPEEPAQIAAPKLHEEDMRRRSEGDRSRRECCIGRSNLLGTGGGGWGGDAGCRRP